MFLMFLYFIFLDKSGIITGGLAGNTAMYFYKEVEYMVYSLTLVIVCITFILIWRNFIDLRNHNEGTEEMQELAGIIRAGAKTFLKREYRIIAPTVLIVALMYSLFREVGSGITFIFGALLSMTAVEIGMRGGTYANVRTTNAARVTGAMSRTMRIALLGGSLSGYSVPAFGLLGFLIVWLKAIAPGTIHSTSRKCTSLLLTARWWCFGQRTPNQ